MTKDELAKKLDGIDYLEIHRRMEEFSVRYPEFLIAVPYSDDLIITSGAIFDEFGAFEGVKLNVVEGKIVGSNNEYGDIIAIWDDYTAWTLNSNKIHASFDIVDDGFEYGNGIIIDKLDLDFPENDVCMVKDLFKDDGLEKKIGNGVQLINGTHEKYGTSYTFFVPDDHYFNVIPIKEGIVVGTKLIKRPYSKEVKEIIDEYVKSRFQ